MAEENEDLLKNIQEKNLELSLYKARKIFLWSDVNDESAKAVVMRLLSLNAEDPTKEIVLYINSPGGLCTMAWPFTTLCAPLRHLFPPCVSAWP